MPIIQISKLCNSSTHDKVAPTRQNIICRGKSVTEIIQTHPNAVSRITDELNIEFVQEPIELHKNGLVIMLLDFKNAFNTVDRNLMLRLATAHCPEIAKLTYWLYANEPHLVTSRGDIVKSSTETQQGCNLSNPLFALTMQWISQKLNKIDGLHVKQFYWDDTALVGTPEAVAQAARVIQNL